MLRIFLILRHQARTIPARAVIFFICLILCTYGKETLTNNYTFISKKNRNSQITNKNEKNETEEKKGNSIVSFLRCMKKYTVLT